MEKEVFFEVGQTVWFVYYNEVKKGIVDSIEESGEYPVKCIIDDFVGIPSFTLDGRFEVGGAINLFQTEPKITIEATPNIPITPKMTIDEMYGVIPPDPHFTHIAIDENGGVYKYTGKPFIEGDYWAIKKEDGLQFFVGNIPRERAEKCWRDSLVEL